MIRWAVAAAVALAPLYGAAKAAAADGRVTIVEQMAIALIGIVALAVGAAIGASAGRPGGS